MQICVDDDDVHMRFTCAVQSHARVGLLEECVYVQAHRFSLHSDIANYWPDDVVIFTK